MQDSNPNNFSRRSLLGMSGAGLAGAIGARAQVTGLTPDGGTPPFRLALGAVDYLDRKQYIHNMKIIPHVSGSTIRGGEPLMAMWVRGKQRLLPANGGFLEPRKIERWSVAHCCVEWHDVTPRVFYGGASPRPPSA